MKKIKINIDENKEKKEKNEILQDKYYNISNQISYVNMCYLDNDFTEKKTVIKDLKKKLSGYRNQDTKKKRYDSEKFIKIDELLEKLVIAKMHCYYCKKQCVLFYKEKRNMDQWTLDRVDNDIGHYGNNVVISCLGCNLQKRRRGKEHFKFAKQMRIVKKY
jgi:hypothetical protein